MSKLQALAFLLLSASPLLAETVLWKANGTLTTGTGVFDRPDISSDDPVSIEVTYSDFAIPQLRGGIFGQEEKDFRTDINLTITITSGTYTWEGFVESAASTIPTTFLTRTQSADRAEFVKLNLSSADSGSFASFPFRRNQGITALELDIQSTSNSLLDSSIGVDDIHPEHISTATGKISTDVGNVLSFNIDPATFEVLIKEPEVVQPFAPTLTLTATPDQVTLSWPSDDRFLYRIESTPDLSAATWTEVEPRFGTGATITRSYPRSDNSLYYRIVALDRPPLE